MIGGQMFFSLYVLDALHRLGIHMSVDGAESYFYAWRVVGAMLGIGIEHAPADLDEARRFSDLYMLRNMGPSQEGVRLTRGRVMQYAIPEELKSGYGIASAKPRTDRWVPPPMAAEV